MKNYHNKRNCSVPCCKKIIIANHKWTCALRSTEERFLSQGSEKDDQLLAQAQFSQRYSLLENSIVYWLDLKDLQHVATKGAKNIGVILRKHDFKESI